MKATTAIATISTATATPKKRAVVRVCGKDVRVGDTTDWRGIVATFIATQDVKQTSRDTYNRTLTQFFKWVENTGRILSQMSRVDILEYKDYLSLPMEEGGCGLSNLTIASYIVAVRKLYEWVEANRIGANIAKGIKTPPRKQAFKKMHLTDEKSRELLNHFKSLSLRDYAIVNLLLRCGLRCIEVARADVGDITFKGNRRILKIWGKGRTEKDDFVILTGKAYEPIAAYLATRKGAKASEPLFASNSRQNAGERLTTRTISQIAKNGLRAIGLDGKEFSAHSLRHTAACAMLNHGASELDVQRTLRHASINTTFVYTQSIKEDIRLQNAPEFVLDNAF